jgi:hypothetical protein
VLATGIDIDSELKEISLLYEIAASLSASHRSFTLKNLAVVPFLRLARDISVEDHCVGDVLSRDQPCQSR